jgi:hypothetical protein
MSERSMFSVAKVVNSKVCHYYYLLEVSSPLAFAPKPYIEEDPVFMPSFEESIRFFAGSIERTYVVAKSVLMAKASARAPHKRDSLHGRSGHGLTPRVLPV